MKQRANLCRASFDKLDHEDAVAKQHENHANTQGL
jgi:hypothetical protein